jgi:hypothetical protein
MALLELAQFTESRIAVKLGVPPYLVGLPSGGDPMTYSNVTQLFDFHHRAGLNTKVSAVMSALSGWALPRGQRVELNRDEYTRPRSTSGRPATRRSQTRALPWGRHLGRRDPHDHHRRRDPHDGAPARGRPDEREATAHRSGRTHGRR